MCCRLDDLGLPARDLSELFPGPVRLASDDAQDRSVWDPWRSVATWYLWRSSIPFRSSIEPRTAGLKAAPAIRVQ